MAVLTLIVAALGIGLSNKHAHATLAAWTDTTKTQSGTNGISIAPWATCAQIPLHHTEGLWAHYRMNDQALVGPTSGWTRHTLADASGNGRTALAGVSTGHDRTHIAVSPSHAEVGTPCSRDPGDAAQGFHNRGYFSPGNVSNDPQACTPSCWNNLTLNLWFKMGGSGQGVLASFSGNADGTDHTLDRRIIVDERGTVRWAVYQAGVRTVQSPAGVDYRTNSWHMVTATLSTSSGMQLYIDGTAVPGRTTVEGPPRSNIRNGYHYPEHNAHLLFGYSVIGASEWTSAGAFDPNYLDAWINEVGVWTRALSADEVRDLYRAAHAVR